MRQMIYSGIRNTLLTTAIATTMVACGGGGGSGGGADDAVMLGDDARRAVLADLGHDVIVPALEEFQPLAESLETALLAYAADPDSAALLESAQSAWASAMASFSRIEVLQLGPAAPSDQPGGENLRDLIYTFPVGQCLVDNNAYAGTMVSATTRIDSMGLGAIEYLLHFSGDNSNCPAGSGVDREQSRADYAADIAGFIAGQSAELVNAWQATGDNFISEWSNAGDGSSTYAMPQDALDALSTALFYVEKDTKDNKIACPTGIGATGLNCPQSDVSRVEQPFARESLPSLLANVQMFRDIFTGLNGGMGVNDLLVGIERQDIATKLQGELDAVITHLNSEISPSFEDEVEAIDDSTACTNASANATGDPAACALHGLIKVAMDTFRTEVVSALSLATPDRAAGDND